MPKKPKRTDFSSICRTCMGTKSLIPIFDDKASVNYYSSVIFMVSGVKVKKEDGLPQKLCTNCIKLINNSIEFRRKSQIIEKLLLKTKNSEILKKDISETNIIENTPADDLSDDETLIKYVNKKKNYKSLGKSNENITKVNNLNNNCFIKRKREIDNTEIKYTKEINNIITEKNDIKIEFTYDIENYAHKDLESKQNSLKNDSHDHIFLIKKELDCDTDDRRSYNHNDTRTKHNDTGLHDNDIGYNHNSTENNINNFVYDRNESGTNHNEARNNHNNTVINHNDSGYNHNGIGTNTNDSAYNESGTKRNEARTNHNDTETNHNDAGYNHNGIETCHNDSGYNNNSTETRQNDSEYNHNATEICHNDSGYIHNDTGLNYDDKNNDNKTKTTDNNTAAITITKMSKNMKNNRVSCKICYKDLSFRSLDVHMTKCHPDLDERKSKCELCLCYIIKNRMKRHVSLHGDGFVCVYCMKEQTNTEALIRHTESCVQRIKKRSDNNSAKELKECDICKKVMQKGSLRLHKRLKHAGLGPVCEHCGKKLSNKFRLSEHLRAKHGYDKHKCSLCDFQTAFRVHLKNHERRHRGEKPYVCETCGSKFHSQNQLIQHKYTHKDKEFKCDQCQSSFKTTVHLSVHKKTTHSTVPMCCSICTRSFRCRHYLLKHIRNVHRVTGPVAFGNQIN